YYDYYQTKDGRYLSVGSLEPQFMQGLAQVLDLPVLLEKGASFDSDDRKQVKQAIQAKILRRTWAEWSNTFAALDIC
ncbi:CoA transferase, partial [Siminovitchia fortis]